jgi:hypothetical protein
MKPTFVAPRARFTLEITGDSELAGDNMYE